MSRFPQRHFVEFDLKQTHFKQQLSAENTSERRKLSVFIINCQYSACECLDKLTEPIIQGGQNQKLFPTNVYHNVSLRTCHQSWSVLDRGKSWPLSPVKSNWDNIKIFKKWVADYVWKDHRTTEISGRDYLTSNNLPKPRSNDVTCDIVLQDMGQDEYKDVKWY